MKNIILTTTGSIENEEISDYLGIITSNLVVGTNFFSDFIASFSDFFGGTSGTYTNQMDSLYNKANDSMIQKASAINADAVVGIRMDFDEINGKGKAMFMISISGTAVRFKKSMNGKNPDPSHSDISSETLKKHLFIKEVSKKMSRNTVPTLVEWNYILNNNLTGLLPLAYKSYIYRKEDPENMYSYDEDYLEKLDSNMAQLLMESDPESASDVLYDDFMRNCNHAAPLIMSCHLFSPSHVYELMEKGPICSEAIQLLHPDYEKTYYDHTDLDFMKKILLLLDNLPDKGQIQEVKSGLLSSKTEKKYICENGHKNDINKEFCETCGMNIKGLTYDDMKVINLFREQVATLEELMK